MADLLSISMKTIILIRHGKSSWKDHDLKDLERPLKKRGIKEAPLTGKILCEKNIVPDLILSSPAMRTAETAFAIARELDIRKVTIRFNEALYLGSRSDLLHEIQQLDNRFETVILVGHNPALTDLANFLADDTIENIPTSGAVGIRFNTSIWQETGINKGEKLFFESPGKKKKNDKKEEQPQMAEPAVMQPVENAHQTIES